MTTTDRGIEYLPLTSLKPAKRNPKGHDLDGVRESLVRFGITQPVAAIDGRTGRMVLGHGRRAALLGLFEDGAPPPNGVRVDESGDWLVPVSVGWRSRNNREADAALVGDNELTIRGGWEDRPGLFAILDGLGDNLQGTGFTVDHVAELKASWDEAGANGSEGPQPGDGSLLSLTDVALGRTPRHEVHGNDVWRVGEHVLIVGSVMRSHDLWSPFLVEGHHELPTLFVPYPGLFVPFSPMAETSFLVMVQPDPYFAALMLDVYEDGHDPGSNERITVGNDVADGTNA